MRRWCAIAGLVVICLLAPVFSGCITPLEDPLVFQGPVRTFTAHYEQHDRPDDLVVSFQIEQGVFAYDGEHRDSLHLEVSAGSVREEGYHLDGALKLVRQDPKYGTWIKWSPWRVPSNGMLWPLLLETNEHLFEHRNIVVEHHGGPFTIEDNWKVYHYEYGGSVPYLVSSKRTGEAELTLKSLEQGEVPEIDPWPVLPAQEGDRDLLFPGAEEAWGGRPASFQRMFDGLIDHSDRVREMIELGGCLQEISSRSPEERPWMTVLGQGLGDPVRVHRAIFHVIAPPQGYDGDQDSAGHAIASGSSLSGPAPGHKGEVWEVRWTEHPYEEDSVEYEMVRDGWIGYKGCDEIRATGPPVSLQDAWDRARKAPGEWVEGNVSMKWRISPSAAGRGDGETYVFWLSEPREDVPDRTLVSLVMDASTGRFIEYYYDDEVTGDPDD